jgi:tetratricopeptide (TPR) repeat protein
LFFGKQFKEAAALIEDVRKTDSSNLVMERLRGYVALENEEYAKGSAAMKRYFAIAKADETIADDYEKYGKLLSKTGQDSLAIINLTKSIAMDTAKAENWGLIGENYFTKKRYADAINAYNQKITNAPAAVKSLDYFRLGSSLYATKQWGKADTAFAKVIDLQPTNILGYLWRARSNAQIDPQSTAGTAKPYYENYITKAEAEPAKNTKGLVEAYSYLGYYYYLQKNNASSKANWDKVLAIEPTNTKAADALKLIK